MQYTTTPSASAVASSSGVINNTGLPGEYAEPATFAPVQVVGRTESAELALADWIRCANEADTRRAKAAELLVTAGRLHLAWCCIMGACVQQVYNAAAVEGINMKSLFADGGDRRSKAMKLSGGAAFAFTYAAGSKYLRLYQGIRQRMEAEGGMSPELLRQSISTHVQAFLAGAWGDRDSLEFFGPYLSTDSLRAELAELFPREPKKPQTVEESMEAQLEAIPASFQDSRAKLEKEWSGYMDTMNIYLDRFIKVSTVSEREAKARHFEDMARRLRAVDRSISLDF